MTVVDVVLLVELYVIVGVSVIVALERWVWRSQEPECWIAGLYVLVWPLFAIALGLFGAFEVLGRVVVWLAKWGQRGD